MEILECYESYFSMLQLKGAFEMYHSSDTKSSVLKSKNHRSPFDMRSSVPRVRTGGGLGNSHLLQQLTLKKKPQMPQDLSS